MCRVCCSVLLAAVSLGAQVPQAAATLAVPLSRALVSSAAPGDPASQALSATMMSIAPRGRRPPKQDVDGLAHALLGVMAGREVPGPQVAALSQSIVNVFSGAGKSNFAVASQLRDELTALRVGDRKTELIVRRFLAIGEAVRGPDDMPAGDRTNLALPPK